MRRPNARCNGAGVLADVSKFDGAVTVRYARRQQLGEEAIGYAHAVKTHALARLGELMKAMPKATGTRGQLAGQSEPGPGGSRVVLPGLDPTPTYADLGVNKARRAFLVAGVAAGFGQRRLPSGDRVDDVVWQGRKLLSLHGRLLRGPRA